MEWVLPLLVLGVLITVISFGVLLVTGDIELKMPKDEWLSFLLSGLLVLTVVNMVLNLMLLV